MMCVIFDCTVLYEVRHSLSGSFMSLAILWRFDCSLLELLSSLRSF